MTKEKVSKKVKICSKEGCWNQQVISSTVCECGNEVFLPVFITVFTKKEQEEWGRMQEEVFENDWH